MEWLRIAHSRARALTLHLQLDLVSVFRQTYFLFRPLKLYSQCSVFLIAIDALLFRVPYYSSYQFHLIVLHYSCTSSLLKH